MVGRAHRKEASYKKDIPHPGTYVKGFLDDLGLRAWDAAHSADIALSRMHDIVNEQAVPTKAECERLSTFIGKNPRWLFVQAQAYREAHG